MLWTCFYYVVLALIVPGRIPVLLKNEAEEVIGIDYHFNPITRLLIHRSPDWFRWVKNKVLSRREEK